MSPSPEAARRTRARRVRDHEERSAASRPSSVRCLWIMDRHTRPQTPPKALLRGRGRRDPSRLRRWQPLRDSEASVIKHGEEPVLFDADPTGPNRRAWPCRNHQIMGVGAGTGMAAVGATVTVAARMRFWTSYEPGAHGQAGLEAGHRRQDGMV